METKDEYVNDNEDCMIRADQSLPHGGRTGARAVVHANASANDLPQELSAKINKSIEQQVAAAASSGKLTIMKNVAMEGCVFSLCSFSFPSRLRPAISHLSTSISIAIPTAISLPHTGRRRRRRKHPSQRSRERSRRTNAMHGHPCIIVPMSRCVLAVLAPRYDRARSPPNPR